MSDVLWRRLRYMLSPQLDLYNSIRLKVAGLDVLEIGFGTGLGTLQLAGSARWVTAIEVDAEAQAFAAKTLPVGNIIWQCQDVHDLDAKGRKYHAAVMIEVLEHIPDWQAALSRVSDQLKPGGKLFISARNANADLRRNDLHEREWTAYQLVTSLRPYFQSVALFDYTLANMLDEDTHVTPLLAVATK